MMSIYTEWINKIKTLASSEWLTDSQRAAYDKIVDQWESAPFICLCGSSGSGKTFIARLLAREKGYIYTNDLQNVSPGSDQVVVDGESYTRLMRSISIALEIRRVIVTAQHPPKDPMPCAKITITERDVRQFQNVITKHDILHSFLTKVESADFGHILRSEAIKRGETNVHQ